MPHHQAFLSHNSADKPAVEEIARRLEADHISCWLDKWNLIPGDQWDVALENALASCNVCVVFFGPRGVGPWHNEEMRLFIHRRVTDPEHHLRVLPVILPGGQRTAESQLPPFLQRTTWVEFKKSLDDTDAFHRLKCGILGQPPGYEPGGAPLAGYCPYVGLKTFRQADASLFFGRDALIQQILTRQQEHFGTPRERRFLALIGASGSGKSSLAAAGLLPAILEHGALPDSTGWLCVQFRPGGNPWESLQVAIGSHTLLRPHLIALQTMITTPELEAHRLHLLARLALHDQLDTQRLVVFVDQFEEFFTLYQPEQDPDGRLAATRQYFLENLLYPSTVSDSRVLVLLTMRADFFGHCAAYDGLREAVSENQLLIGPLNQEGLCEAIERPAQLCGCEVEPALIERLLNDMELQPGALPFLQHTLFKLWEARDGRRLTAAAYHDMGSLEGALDAHSESFYTSLSEDKQKLVRTILLDLIQLGEGTADTKRRRQLSQLADGDVKRLHPFIAELANAHLVVTDQVAGQVQVEISHETLITGWKRLHSWINESRDEKRQKDRIEIAAMEWEAAKPSERNDFLWRGAQLESAEFALSKSTSSLNEQANRFLAACREQIERQRQEIIAKAKELVVRAEILWREFLEVGIRNTDDWRLMRLAEIESILVDALAHDLNANDAEKMLAGIRWLLVETGIQTQDLNFAEIYFQKLQKSSDTEAANGAAYLGRELEEAWSKADPKRNIFVLRMRKWAIIGCWLPQLWSIGLWMLVYLGFKDRELAVWVISTAGMATLLHYIAALFAVMIAFGEQRRLRWTRAVSLILVFVGLAALNPLSVMVAAVLAHCVEKINMQKQFWPSSDTRKS